MITAVDSNVLFDVLRPDPAFAAAAREALRRCRADGPLIAGEVVWAEVAAGAPTVARLREAMVALDVDFVPSGAATAETAGAAWAQYRRQGGSRSRVISDFLVAAHAQRHADRLLTRDRGFYRRYFTRLAILDPTTM